MLTAVSGTTILLARDEEPNGLRRAVTSGELVRVRRGAYLRAASGDAASCGDPSCGNPGADARARPVRSNAERSRLWAVTHARAVHAQLRAPHVLSHSTAALLWGLRLWSVDKVTHLRQRSRAGGDRAGDIVRHVGLPEAHAVIDGLPVTSLAQTVLDCALTMPVLDALVVTDAALGQGLRADEVRDRLALVRKPNGTARAALVLDLTDGGAESAWETWLRYLAARLGLPRPVLQYAVATHLGTYRVDVAWPEQRVLAEFDGQVKHTDGAFGQRYSGRRALVEEKRREDAIAETIGLRPIRFMAADARDPDAAARRLLARFPPDIRATIRTDRRLPRPTPP
jgi:hypothetical protein